MLITNYPRLPPYYNNNYLFYLYINVIDKGLLPYSFSMKYHP